MNAATTYSAGVRVHPSQDVAYRPDVDGLRAIAVLMVVGFHASPGRVQGGYIGVDVFFVISGFLISRIILRQLESGTFDYWDFYARRIRRIFPALVTVLLVVLALGGIILLPDEFRHLGEHIFAGALFSSNLLLWSEAGYFDITAESKPLLHLWSLGVEEQFYLVWPIALVALWRLRNHLLTWIVIVVVASFLLNIGIVYDHPSAAFYSPMTRLWQLAAGAALATAVSREFVLTPQSTHAAGGEVKRAILGNVASVAGLACICASAFLLNNQVKYPGWVAVIPTLGALLLISAGSATWINRRILSNRVIVYIGLISYPLYLWHWPLLSFVRIYDVYESDGASTIRLLKLTALFLSFLGAAITYELVEKPFRRLPATRIAKKLLLTMMGIALLGVYLIYEDGLPWRTPTYSDPFGWDQNMYSTPACVKSFKQPVFSGRQNFCVHNESASRPGIVVIGDSHANALYQGVLDSNREKLVLMLGAASCPFLRNIRSWVTAESARMNDCPAIIEHAYQALGSQPQTVILNSRMAYFLSRSGFGKFESDQTPKTYSFDSPAFPGESGPEFFHTALLRDLTHLTNAGHTVILVLQVPELGFHPRSCVRLRPIDVLLQRNVQECSIPRRDVEKRQAIYRTIVAEVLRELKTPKITLIDPMNALCDQDRCYASKNGVMLYRDDDHLSREGSSWLWRQIAPGPMPTGTAN